MQHPLYATLTFLCVSGVVLGCVLWYVYMTDTQKKLRRQIGGAGKSAPAPAPVCPTSTPPACASCSQTACTALMQQAIPIVPDYLTQTTPIPRYLRRTADSAAVVRFACYAVAEYCGDKVAVSAFSGAPHYAIVVLSLLEVAVTGSVNTAALREIQSAAWTEMQEIFGEPFPYRAHAASVGAKVWQSVPVQSVLHGFLSSS